MLGQGVFTDVYRRALYDLGEQLANESQVSNAGYQEYSNVLLEKSPLVADCSVDAALELDYVRRQRHQCSRVQLCRVMHNYNSAPCTLYTL